MRQQLVTVLLKANTPTRNAISPVAPIGTGGKNVVVETIFYGKKKKWMNKNDKRIQTE